MRILFMVGRYPYPPLRGDQVRAFNLVRTLSRRHQVTLLAFDREPAEAAGVFADLGVRVVTEDTALLDRGLSLARLALSDVPLQAALYATPAQGARLRAALAAGFDIAHVQLVRLAPLASELGTLPFVIDFVDALSLNMARRAQHDRWLGPLWRVESRRLQRAESALLARAGHGVVVSEADRQALGGGPRLSIVPNGVDCERFRFDGARRPEPTVAFTGNLGYFANADAAVWFARAAFPLVRRRVPRARLLVAGARPGRAVRRLASLDGVSVLGPVGDMAALLRQARVAVAPLRSGTGQQSKVLEAMASGTPVVATTLAAAGLEVTAGEHLLIADGAEAFADAVVRLLEDDASSVPLAQHARRLVEERYTWERSVDLLEKVYARVVAG